MPLAGVAGPVVLVLGVLCIAHAAITLALAGAAWNLPAHACLGLAAALAVSRLLRERRRMVHTLRWDNGRACFRIHPNAPELALTHMWQGPGWVTLKLRPRLASGPVLHLAVWKSAIPAPLWSRLALCAQAGALWEAGHQNKENP